MREEITHKHSNAATYGGRKGGGGGGSGSGSDSDSEEELSLETLLKRSPAFNTYHASPR
jgi:hypothetical protein